MVGDLGLGAGRGGTVSGAIASCSVQRAESPHSVRNRREYDEIAEMFTDLYPDVSVPKNATTMPTTGRAGHLPYRKLISFHSGNWPLLFPVWKLTGYD
ncbi:hypothetical protein [Streptomyces sp. SD31]|uniref:hypothetical protein n=1 Tax=Streptomyces sp. SD31 TaxID=3452208 RepID=UPI003F8B1FC4